MSAADRRLLGLLGLAIVFEGHGRSLVSVMLPVIGRDLAVSASALSFANAVIAAGALGGLVLGGLADRFGRRRLLLACVLGYALLGVATASATTLAALVVWQATARLFQEGALAAAVVIAVEEMPAARRGLAQGVLGTMNAVGAGLPAFLLGFIDHVPGGWRGISLLSLVPLALLPLLRRSIPETRRWTGTRRRQTLQALPAGYGSRMVAGLAVAFLGMTYDVAGFAFTTYWPMTHHDWSPARTSALIVVAGGIGLPGFWLGGRLADHTGRRVTAALFYLGLTLAELTFFLGRPALLWPAFAAMVFCQAGKTTVFRSWASELFPTSFRASAVGWLNAAATVGGMAGLAIAGALARGHGDIGHALVVVSTAGIAAAVACTCLPETRGLELEVAAPEARSPRRDL